MAFRIYFGIASLTILALCMVNYWIELTPSWKSYQHDYYALLADKIEDPAKAAEVAATPPKFVQIYNQELGVADRCVICHLGTSDPLMEGAESPYQKHPGNLLATHSYQALGCTMCHHGQGLATTLADAHGQVADWHRPVLIGDFVQATCSQCHHEDEIPQAPVLTHGKDLLKTLGCVGCHVADDLVNRDKVGPRLAVIGSKVSRQWLNRWIMNPKGYLPKGKMPVFHLPAPAANAIGAYLMSFKDPAIDSMPQPKGNHGAGADIFRESQCIVCHVTREDDQGNPVGGTFGPDLRKLGNKVNQRWLVAFLKNPHAMYPHTTMPRFNFTEKQAQDLAEYAMEEWVDYDLRDAEKKAPKLPPVTKELVEQGKRLYAQLDCAGCHDLPGQTAKPDCPDLTYEGSKAVHDLDFGDAHVRRTLPDFLYTKLKSPKALASRFHVPINEDPAASLWRNLQPSALFSASMPLPEGSEGQRLAFILAKVQEEGVLDHGLRLPDAPAAQQAAWLEGKLNDAGALTSLKMPDFRLSDPDAEALTIALMGLNADRISSRRYEVPKKTKVIFDPEDDFGALEERYDCLSCHSIRGSGTPQACDITYEGNKVHRDWLEAYLKRPYSMRRMITIAMPIFNFPDKQAHFMAGYISQVFVDRRVGTGWKEGSPKADVARGKALFDAKGCIACHQLHEHGGDVGPAFTTQVPEFPHGTWVGDKLRGDWVYQWLKNPQSLVPGTIEPNQGFTDQEALDLTAYLLSLKNPEFQKKK